jgi:hypothetical protein
MNMDPDNINRTAERLLDPALHTFVPSGSFLLVPRCQRCLKPLDQHPGLVRLAWRLLVRWLRRRRA